MFRNVRVLICVHCKEYFLRLAVFLPGTSLAFCHSQLSSPRSSRGGSSLPWNSIWTFRFVFWNPAGSNSTQQVFVNLLTKSRYWILNGFCTFGRMSPFLGRTPLRKAEFPSLPVHSGNLGFVPWEPCEGLSQAEQINRLIFVSFLKIVWLACFIKVILLYEHTFVCFCLVTCTAAQEIAEATPVWSRRRVHCSYEGDTVGCLQFRIQQTLYIYRRSEMNLTCVWCAMWNIRRLFRFCPMLQRPYWLGLQVPSLFWAVTVDNWLKWSCRRGGVWQVKWNEMQKSRDSRDGFGMFGSFWDWQRFTS